MLKKHTVVIVSPDSIDKGLSNSLNVVDSKETHCSYFSPVSIDKCLSNALIVVDKKKHTIVISHLFLLVKVYQMH